jgi:hypothetical protein
MCRLFFRALLLMRARPTHAMGEQAYHNQCFLSSLEKQSSIAPPPTPKQGTAFHPPDGIVGAFKPDFL